MKKSSLLPVFSVLGALMFIAAGVTHFLMPPEQIHFAHGITERFFTSLAANPLAFHIHYWTFAAGALLGIGVFINLPETEKNMPFFRFSRTLAIIGLVLMAVDFLRMHNEAMHLASAFQGFSKTTKQVIIAKGIDHIDPYGIAFNLTGIFVFFLSYQWFRTGFIPAWIAVTGILGGVLLQFVLVGILTHTGILVDLAAGLGGIVLFPVWLMGMSFQFLNQKER